MTGLNFHKHLKYNLTMSQITITKGKLLKGDKIEIDYQQKNSADENPASLNFEQEGKPRPQLRTAFNKLRIHAALLSEFLPLTEVENTDEVAETIVQDFKVTGFTIVSHKKTSAKGVIITASKLLNNGKNLGFNTPTTSFDDDSENAYPFIGELSKDVDVCKDELRQYLNGVRESNPQGTLDLPE